MRTVGARSTWKERGQGVAGKAPVRAKTRISVAAAERGAILGAVTSASPSNQRRLFWQLQIFGWAAVVPLFAGVLLLIFPEPAQVVAVAVGRQLIGFALTLGLWRVYRRWPADEFRLRRQALPILLWCAAATAVDLGVAEVARRLLGVPQPEALALRGSLLLRGGLYLGWSTLYFFIRQELAARATELRLAQTEAAAREAELHVLRAQVNPHFLLNALNAIIAHAHDNPEAVMSTTYALADYLRFSLRHGEHRAALAQELDAMISYLQVEQARFGGKLDWQIDATDDARAASAPTALVQPLIENALKYGSRTASGELRLRVLARVEGSELKVVVENSGAWLAREPGRTAESTGIGLGNLRRRLVLLCGEQAALTVTTPAGCVRVEVRLPMAG